MKKINVLIPLVILLLLLSGCQCEHDWVAADCLTPKTCSLCGETEGEALGHDWQDATCKTPKTCALCSEAEGESAGHEWIDATCSKPKTCAVCGSCDGDALGHNWKEATCTEASTCEQCHMTDGYPLGHAFPSDVFGQVYNGWAADTSSDGDIKLIRYCTLCEQTVESKSSEVALDTFSEAVSNGVFTFTDGELVSMLKSRGNYLEILCVSDDSGVFFLYPLPLILPLSASASTGELLGTLPYLYFLDADQKPIKSHDVPIDMLGIGIRNYDFYPELCNSLIVDTILACAPHFDEETAFVVVNAIFERIVNDKQEYAHYVFGNLEIIVTPHESGMLVFNFRAY